MKVLKWFGGIVGGLLLLVLGIGFFLDTQWHVEISTTIKAGPEEIHPYIADFKKWEHWSAFDTGSDPSLKYEYSGKESGVGAIMSWKGDSTGRGQIEFTESDPKTGLKYEGRIETDEVNAHGSITYQKVEGGTKVTWLDETDVGMTPIGGWLVTMFEGMMADHFQKSLDRLKAKVEAK